MPPGQVRLNYWHIYQKIPWAVLRDSDVIHNVHPSAKVVPANRRIGSLGKSIETFQGEDLSIKEYGDAKSDDAGVHPYLWYIWVMDIERICDFQTSQWPVTERICDFQTSQWPVTERICDFQTSQWPDTFINNVISGHFYAICLFRFYVKTLIILYIIIYNRTSISFQVYEPKRLCNNNLPIYYSYPSLALYQLTLVSHYFSIPLPQMSSTSISYGCACWTCCSGQCTPSAHHRPADPSSQSSCSPICCSPC